MATFTIMKEHIDMENDNTTKISSLNNSCKTIINTPVISSYDVKVGCITEGRCKNRIFYKCAQYKSKDVMKRHWKKISEKELNKKYEIESLKRKYEYEIDSLKQKQEYEIYVKNREIELLKQELYKVLNCNFEPRTILYSQYKLSDIYIPVNHK